MRPGERRTSRCSRRGRHSGFSWHDFFSAGPAAELGRSAPIAMQTLQELIDEAKEEYRRHEMLEPYLLDGTSEMHARNALDYLCSERWAQALTEARIAAEQRSRWQHFADIVTIACHLGEK